MKSKNKYEELSDMLKQVLDKLNGYKGRLEENQCWIRKEKSNIVKHIDDIEEKLGEVEYISYVLSNFKEILIDIIKQELLVPGGVIALALTAILSFSFNVFNNPVMFLTALGISLGTTLIGLGIEFFIEANEAINIKKKYNLPDVLSEKSDLQIALKVKKSDLNSLIQVEKQTADGLANAKTEYATFQRKLEDVYAVRVATEHKYQGNIDEIDKVFENDQNSNDTMRLAREKLEVKPEK